METNKKKRTRVAAAAAGIALGGSLLVAPSIFGGAAANAAENPNPWQSVRLQPLAEGDATHVNQLNNAGFSVGKSGTKPVIWSPAGKATALPLPEGCTTGEATSIARTGLVAAGVADCGDGAADTTGIVWTQDGATKLEAPLGVRDVSGTGFTVGQRSATNDNAFVFVKGSPRLDLPDGGASSSEANAITEYGFIVGTTHGVPTLPASVATGWYGNQVFPLLQVNVASEGIDATESAYSLVQITGTANDHPVVVTPQGGIVNLNSDGAKDVGVDLTENGFVLGYRQASADSEATVGVVYLNNGAAVRLDQLASSADTTTYGFDKPAAMNDGLSMVGNHGNVSWLLKPPAPKTTTTTAAPTTTTTVASLES
jgi:hypothetical protein